MSAGSNRNEELSSMLSYEISYLSSNTSVTKLSVGRDIIFSDTWSLHGRTVRLLNGHLR